MVNGLDFAVARQIVVWDRHWLAGSQLVVHVYLPRNEVYFHLISWLSQQNEVGRQFTLRCVEAGHFFQKISTDWIEWCSSFQARLRLQWWQSDDHLMTIWWQSDEHTVTCFFCFAGCKHLVITTQLPPRFFLKAPAADRGGVPTLADQRSRGHLMSPGQNSHDCDIFKDPLKIEFCWLMLRNYCNMFCHVLSMENHNSTTPRMMFLMFSWAKQYKSFRQCFLWAGSAAGWRR